MKDKNPFHHLDCDFELRQSKRAKRISLRVLPPQTVRLTIPYGSSINQAIAFAEKQARWVEKHLRIAQEKKHSTQRIITAKDHFQTKFHRFLFIPHEKRENFIRIEAGETRLFYHKNHKQSDDEIQALFRIALKQTYRLEAKSYLPTRLKALAQQHGFSYHKVTIRDSKKRWGSCSNQKNISLSLSLMALPFHLIDYILLHELCHTVEMNHGKRFHQLLDSVCHGKSKALNQEVKQYSIP